MKKNGLSVLVITVIFLSVSSIAGWAYTPPTPRTAQPEQEKATQSANQPPSSYDVQESPLSPPVITKEVQSEPVPTLPANLNSSIKNTASVTVDISQGMDTVQKALDQLPKNGALEIIGQGVLASDSLRIPAGTTINISQDVSLVLGDLKAGNLPMEGIADPVGTGTSMTTTASSSTEITGTGTGVLTVEGLKADIQQLQKNLKIATTAQARKEIRESIQRDRELIRETRQANMKSIHKKNVPVTHQHVKKK
jgi:hypothetical protein